MKYYLDEDISPKIADILTGYQIDTKSSHEVVMNQSIDIEQLELAASQGQCFVTRNRNDFIMLMVQFFNQNRTHHGVFIIPHTISGDKFSIIASVLKKYAIKYPSGMEPYTIGFLE